ncbi:MAG: hypothetical protein H6651_00755 [Ardenticatenales bacterium]|nr:hypothetical protein [Ardenticatenales bacterium]
MRQWQKLKLIPVLTICLVILSACDLFESPPTPTAIPAEATALTDSGALQRVTSTATRAATATPAAALTNTPAATSTVPAATALPTPTLAPPTATATPAPSATATEPPPATSTATPTATELPAIENSPDAFWAASYFDNPDFSGQPFRSEQLATIGHHWGLSRPAGLPETFGVRWQRNIALPARSYRLYVWSRGGVRVRLNDVIVLEDWQTGPLRLNEVSVSLADAIYTVVIDHYQIPGPADFHIWWEPQGNTEWTATYWANRDLSGTPVSSEQVETLAVDWNDGAPVAGLGRDNFSVRWERTVDLAGGLYRFDAGYDDGLRLYVDGLLLIDDWQTGVARTASAELWLEPGRHQLVVDYFEGLGQASASLSWQRLGQTFPNWRGEYFANTQLLGVPVQLRNDLAPDFDWGQGAPIAGVGPDTFSVRWSRRVSLEAGVYRLAIRADDGFRLYLDGVLVLDRWANPDQAAFHEVRLQLTGQHLLELLYYDQSFAANIAWELERLGPILTE